VGKIILPICHRLCSRFKGNDAAIHNPHCETKSWASFSFSWIKQIAKASRSSCSEDRIATKWTHSIPARLGVEISPNDYKTPHPENITFSTPTISRFQSETI
jgi:hypothetical protein